MITEKMYYGIKCDACGKEFEDGEGYSHYDERCFIEDMALSSEWISVRGKHYCDKCYKYGDNDELILGDGTIIEADDVEWQ